MARQLRHHYAGEWYHIATRGMGQREIFCDDRDCEHFLELLEGMVGRYGIVLHAYVLIENHRTRRKTQKRDLFPFVDFVPSCETRRRGIAERCPRIARMTRMENRRTQKHAEKQAGLLTGSVLGS